MHGNADYPILDFDPSREAIIEPSKVLSGRDVPVHCIMPMLHLVIKQLVSDGVLTQISQLESSAGPFPVYRLEYHGHEIAVVHPGIGAPLAAGILEEMIAIGCRHFVACGGAGVLDGALARGSVFIPTTALRDEGTSYHYLPPSREIAADPTVIKKLERILQLHKVKYATGKTWTTDGFYRETAHRRDRRKAEGCMTVEMECAALMAVAQFRGVQFGQLLASADDISGVNWDFRHSEKIPEHNEKLFWLAAECCLEL